MDITVDKAITHLWAAMYGASFALIAAREDCLSEFHRVPWWINHLDSVTLLAAILVLPLIYYWRRDTERRRRDNPKG